ncbi:hypothetical protein ElyMa_000982500, partial [Elysia marginata]
ASILQQKPSTTRYPLTRVLLAIRKECRKNHAMPDTIKSKQGLVIVVSFAPSSSSSPPPRPAAHALTDLLTS